jgi:hypothetical protein
MEERDVQKVDVSLVSLEVIAVAENFGGENMVFGSRKTFKAGEHRRLSGTHIGKDDAGPLLARIGWMTDRASVRVPAGFSRLIETAAAQIVEPAVIDAPEASVLHPPVAQVSAAMRAMEAQQAGPSRLVTKEDQFLAEQRDRQRRSSFGQFL